MGDDQLLKIGQLKKTGRHKNINCSAQVKQLTKKVKTGQKSKIICRTCILSSFTFRQKNINCSNCNWSTKVLEKVNCATQFIVKKMVYMYGSQVRCQVRSGQIRLGQVRLGQVRLGQERLGQERLGQERLGQERLGQERLGQVGQVRS